jgi:hypothetical protein
VRLRDARRGANVRRGAHASWSGGLSARRPSIDDGGLSARRSTTRNPNDARDPEQQRQ